MTPILHVEGISRRFGGYLALNNVSCDFVAGQIHALIGPNGAGKTTLFNVISGALRPTAGQVVFEGMEYTGRRPDRVLENGYRAKFPAGAAGSRPVRRRERHDRLSCPHRSRTARQFRGVFWAWAALKARRGPKRARCSTSSACPRNCTCSPMELTLVDQRRLEIARALASEPRLLLLDEPAAGMNHAELDQLSALIKTDHANWA